MLNLGEIKQGKLIEINDEPYIVVKADHHKVARGGAVLKTKLKNLINGNVIDKTFQGNDKAKSAETEKQKSDFLYLDDDNAYFMNQENFEQFTIPIDFLAKKEKFLKEGASVDIVYFKDKPISIEFPAKMDFKVTVSPPGVKGNSTGNVTKQIEIETGMTINTPLFIKEGDIIRINTDTGEYCERVS